MYSNDESRVVSSNHLPSLGIPWEHAPLRASTWGIWLGSLIAALTPAVCAHAFFTPYYQSNDDIGIDASFRGVLVTGETSYFTYCHSYLGRAIVYLYQLFPNWPCYRIVCASIHVLSTTVLIAWSFTRNPSRSRMLLALAWLLLFDFPAHVFPQFTVTACHAAMVGAVVFLTPRVKEWIYWRITAVALLTLGGMLRADSLPLALVVVTPVSVLRAIGISGRTSKRDWTSFLLRTAGDRGIWTLILTASLSFALSFTRRIEEQRAPGQVEFYRFNAVRAEVVDYRRVPAPENMPRVLAKAELSYNDFVLLNEWFYPDEKIVTQEKLELLVAAAPPFFPSFDGLSRSIVSISRTPRFYLPMMFILFALLSLAWDRVTLLEMATVTGTIVSLLCVLILFFHLPERALMGIVGGGAAFAFGGLSATPEQLSGRRRQIAFWLGALCFIPLSVSATYNESIRAIDRHIDYSQRLASFADIANGIPLGGRLVVVGTAFSFDALPAATTFSSERNWPVLWLNSQGVHAPTIKSRLKAMRVDDVVDSFDDPRTYVMCRPFLVEPILTFVREHKQRERSFEFVVMYPKPNVVEAVVGRFVPSSEKSKR